MGNFQTQVFTQPAPGVEGDFCDANPRSTVDAGPGGLVAGPNGVTVGRFAWTVPPEDANGTNQVANSFGTGPVTGFVHREQQALIAVYLQDASLLVPTGFGVVLHSSGGFWAKNRGAGQALVGMKAYANFADGSVSFAATGSPSTGGSATGTIAAETYAVTGAIAGNVLSVSAVGSGTVVPGSVISGSGVASGTVVTSQVTPLLPGEATGGIGRYEVSIPEQTVASTAIAGTYGLFTAASGLTGAFAVGDTLSGSGVSAGTYISALGTGTGGLGTYIVNLTQTVGSTAISAAGNVETKWIAMSTGLNGELVKISSQALG